MSFITQVRQAVTEPDLFTDDALQQLERQIADACGIDDTKWNKLATLAQITAFHREALDAAAIVAVTDRNGAITSVNRKFCEISGYSREELVGANHRILRSGEHDRAFFMDLYRTISGGAIWHGVICNRNKSGDLYWVDTTIVPHRDQSGYTAIRFDVTPQKNAEQRLWSHANRDDLTGLANRRRLLTLLEDAVGKGAPFAVAIIDIDHFKDVNDNGGHDAGDRLLKNVAGRLQDCVGPDEIVGRVGGDEFAIILKDDGDAAYLGERLSQLAAIDFGADLAQPLPWPVHASIGAARFGTDARTGGELMKHADMALYVAKQNGRGCARLFEPLFREEAEQRSGLRTRIKRALAHSEIAVHYQPIIGLMQDEPINFEALLRWQDPDAGLRSPASFMSVFDDEQVATAIGQFVLASVVQQIDDWNRRGFRFGSVAINTTLGDLRTPHFVDALLDAISRGRIRHDQVCIEITEGMLLDRGARTVRTAIERLHKNGIKIAFDDFGTGFASLTHLRALPINHVKIDRSFVEPLCEEHKDRVIVESVIGLAHKLGMTVVAEGVENEEQATALRSMECDSIQGFLVAPALTAAQADCFLSSQRVHIIPQ